MRAAAASIRSSRDLDACFADIEAVCRHARYDDVDLLVLPAGALGGRPGPYDEAPAVDLDGEEVRRLCCIAGGVVVVLGLTELGPDGARHQTALCLSGDGVLGEQRVVHRDPVDVDVPEPRAFDTPLGRLGLLVGHDRTLPGAARSLARDGAEVLCAAAAWTGARSGHDAARAAENQVFVVAATESAEHGGFVLGGQATVVAPTGQVLAASTGHGTAVAQLDLQQVFRTRRQQDHRWMSIAPVPA